MGEADSVGTVERASLARPEGVATRGALPRLRGRRGRHPWSVPRLRGRRGRHPWSVASLARPEGSPPVERCLACEAVVNKGALFCKAPARAALYRLPIAVETVFVAKMERDAVPQSTRYRVLIASGSDQ